MSAPIVGIDLGTSNSVIATVLNGEAVVLPDRQGHRVFPSIVSFAEGADEPTVGHEARALLLQAPEQTIASAKRLIGRHWFSESVQAARKTSSVPLTRGPNDTVLFASRTPPLTVEEVQAQVLRHVVRVATDYLGVPPTRAVITVPANFNEAQRQATRLAGELAGLEVLRILNEPTAAALAYGSSGSRRERLAIYDLGGGTFDITLLEVRDNVIEVLSTAGDTFLGGDDIDAALADHLAKSIEATYRGAPRWAPHASRRLAVYAEQMKVALGVHERVGIEAEGLLLDAPSSVSLRADNRTFERCILPILQQTFLVCDQAFQLAGLSTAQIDRLILVGGSTRSPAVARLVESYFGRPSSGDINPDEVVALGAAVFAHAIAGEELPMDLLEELEDESPAPPPLPSPATPPTRGAPAPTTGPAGTTAASTGMQRQHATSERESGPEAPPGTIRPNVLEASPEQRAGEERPAGSPSLPPRRKTAPGGHAYIGEVDPPPAPHPGDGTPSPEATSQTGNASGVQEERTEPWRAQGTAPAGSVKPAASSPAPSPRERGSVRARRGSVLLIDVVPRALGVRTAGGFTDIIVPRNASLPTRGSRRFTTSSDRQTTVRLSILEGEAKRAEDNHALGQLMLTGLPERPRGQVSVEVTFEINTEGMLHIEARDLERGQRQEVTLHVTGVHAQETLRKLREGRD